MKYVSIEEVVAMHYQVIISFGGQAGIHDFTLLHSAIERPKVTFGGKDLYETIFTKAAALLQSLILNHPFVDGNKRTAYVACARFLYINGYVLRIERTDIVDFLLKVESKKLKTDDISQLLEKHVFQT